MYKYERDLLPDGSGGGTEIPHIPLISFIFVTKPKF